MSNAIDPSHLALTARGIAWIDQFDPLDRESARALLEALTLVSHNAFERGLTKTINRVAEKAGGPIALYATREWDPDEPYFPDDDDPIDAVDAGNDLGSEARIAAIIRNLARAEPQKFLNHPTIEEMRAARCRALCVVDDFIGSGERTSEFLAGIWHNKTLRAWRSLHLISLHAIAYSATARGRRRVERTKIKPEVILRRDCPTFLEMPWSPPMRRSMIALIRRYALRTSQPNLALGYGQAASALVFEHGCPDNCPAIFWAPPTSTTAWQPLFPRRSVLATEASAFPPEIARRDPVVVMIQAGQKRLAASGALTARGPIGPTVLMVLGLAARGIRSKAALAHATGMDADTCAKLVEACVGAGLLTPNFHITRTGAAELEYASRAMLVPAKVPPVGSDSYYPRQLRGLGHG